jgi:transcriptional regulator with XRE-family HTH domain
VEHENGRPPEPAQPPDRHITINQVIAWNLAYYRRAANITQEELGAMLGGRPKTAISADERSWDGKRTREFNAQEITEIAIALGVPIGALFLPPTDDGIEARYLFTANDGTDDEPRDMADLTEVVMPDSGKDAPAANLYRGRVRAAVGRYLDETWGPEVDRWFDEAGGPEMAADRAARIRMRRDVLREIADEYGELADIAEKGPAS